MSSERLGLILILLLLSACSVREDRSSCPCLLSVALEAAPLTLRVAGEDFLLVQDFPRDTLVRIKVPRSGVELEALRGAEFRQDGSVRIPYGYDSPPVFVDVCRVETDAETAEVLLHPDKSFCSLSIDFDGPPGAGEPYRVDIRGEVDGWNPDGTLSGGEFSCRFSPDSEGKATVRLPRQMDSSLMMDILFADRIVRTFALGETIAGSAYDWGAKELSDLSLTLKLSLTDFHFKTELWVEDVHLQIEI